MEQKLMLEPVVIDESNLTVGTLSESARGYIRASKSEATLRAYKSDLKAFSDWCESNGVNACPAAPETVSEFLASQADNEVKPSTLVRRLAAIKFAHDAIGADSPTDSRIVKETMRGIRRKLGTKADRKAAATDGVIKAMVAHCDDSLTGKRDRALLLLGFAGALRRSELVGLTVDDLDWCEQGLRVHIRRSKTDQTCEGQVVAIINGKLHTLEALKAWLTGAGIESGPVFRSINRHGHISEQALSDRSVADLVKKYAKLCGLDPEMFSGHSLRAGFVTSAAAAGASITKIVDVTRHRSLDEVLTYVRDADLFNGHAGQDFL